MKVCSTCKIEKNLFDFYEHKAMKDGHLNKCKECVKSRVKSHRDVNIDSIREYDRSRSTKPHRVAARAAYAETEAGMAASKKARMNYIERNPMIRACHVIVGNALRDGRLLKANCCSSCSSKNKLEGHHDDYTKPLDVRWLCVSCHKEWHKTNEPIYK